MSSRASAKSHEPPERHCLNDLKTDRASGSSWISLDHGLRLLKVAGSFRSKPRQIWYWTIAEAGKGFSRSNSRDFVKSGITLGFFFSSLMTREIRIRTRFESNPWKRKRPFSASHVGGEG